MTTRKQMDERYRVLFGIAQREQPIPARGVSYRTLSTPAGHPLGVKNARWFKTVERALVAMRRGDPNTPAQYRIPHAWISEAGRRSHVPNTWDGPDQPLESLTTTFRRSLWTDAEVRVEIWCEAASMMGVLRPVTNELDVTLRPSEGFGSESFVWNAAQAINAAGLECYVYQVGDFDPYGLELWDAIQERLQELTTVKIHFIRLAATLEDRDQNPDLTHPAKRPKNDNCSAITRTLKHTKVYGDRVLEVEAIPTPVLRARVHEAIMAHIDQEHIDAVREQQQADREEFKTIATDIARRREGATVDIEEKAGDVVDDLWYADDELEAFRRILRITAGMDHTDLLMLVHELAKRVPEDDDDE